MQDSDKYRTFNMGVGMVLVCDSADADCIAREADGYILGELEKGDQCVKFV